MNDLRAATKGSRGIAGGYQFVRYRPDLKQQIMELQTNLWSPSLALNQAYFEWKYERNPYLQSPLIYLAMHEDKAVGMRGFFGVKLESGTSPQICTCLYADDMVISPEHRDIGLVTKVMKSAFDDLANRGFSYVLNMSAGPMTLLSSLSMGWRSAGCVAPMHWQSTRTMLRSRVRAALERLPVVSRKLNDLRSRGISPHRRSLADVDLTRVRQAVKGTQAISVEEVPRCAAMAELVQRVRQGGRIRHVRDEEYFRWRFQNPLSRYRFLYWDGDRLEGYIVLQDYTSEMANAGVINIVDWEADNADTLEQLLRTALRFAESRQMVIWSASMAAPVIAMLQKNGFRSDGRRMGGSWSTTYVLVRSIDEKTPFDRWMLADVPLLDLANWDVRMLYSMRG